ncbi:TPR repeat containing exported protein; Putative periplasmic protein contains a protein prenylyltransferase domain [hydrothermal vent metagenome]|uniref:TPR repeat containing exported protein Putative periplasmic protein contains a protein prenylyltransferase domain n=1 Tax=hydrothermal vent metagenome TaxID=652676 RepID=A0A1W1CK05_9ZZZZ
MNRFYLLLLSFFSPLVLLAAEPSAFGAGDITSGNPYGLTKDEKLLLETEKKLKKVSTKSKLQATQLESLRERVDGLQSVLESLSRKAQTNKINLQNIEQATDGSLKSIEEYQKRLSLSIQKNKEEIDALKHLTSELTKSLEAISIDYVTKADYNALVTNVNNFKIVVAKEIKQIATVGTKKDTIAGIDLYKRAKSNYKKKLYTKALSDYEELIKRNYRPAHAHYMVGEIYFKRKDYAKAISYFKKSASLYSKASYMPKLLLHTAIAMLKTGDKQHANAFFQAIVAKYPNAKEAQVAKKYLDNL